MMKMMMLLWNILRVLTSCVSRSWSCLLVAPSTFRRYPTVVRIVKGVTRIVVELRGCARARVTISRWHVQADIRDTTPHRQLRPVTAAVPRCGSSDVRAVRRTRRKSGGVHLARLPQRTVAVRPPRRHARFRNRQGKWRRKLFHCHWMCRCHSFVSVGDRPSTGSLIKKRILLHLFEKTTIKL